MNARQLVDQVIEKKETKEKANLFHFINALEKYHWLINQHPYSKLILSLYFDTLSQIKTFRDKTFTLTKNLRRIDLSKKATHFYYYFLDCYY